MTAPASDLSESTIHGLAVSVLGSFQSSAEIVTLCGKLENLGIQQPTDLLRSTKEALENNLSTHPDFSYIEMTDVLRLQSAAKGFQMKSVSWGEVVNECPPEPVRVSRSRSRSADNCRDRKQLQRHGNPICRRMAAASSGAPPPSQ